MPPATPRHPNSVVEADAAPRIPAPRARAPAGRTRDEGSAGVELSAITRARVWESAPRNATAVDLFEAGRYDEAVPLLDQALTSCRSTLGPDHAHTLGLVECGRSNGLLRRET